MLTLENISCRRGDRILFRNLGFTLGDNCILIVRGENGSGKTTLLETIACLRRSEGGRLLYANKNVRGENYQEYCDIVQYVGHKKAIKPQLTIKENIGFWAKLKGNTQAVAAAIAFFGLEKYADSQCAILSAGYQKRVALAMLMVTNSEVWLLDEPFTNLDNKGREALANLIISKCERGGTAIITAHGEVPFKNYLEIDLAEFSKDQYVLKN